MAVDFALQGKVAVVTGAAGGIGQAFVRELGGVGASIVVADLDAEATRQVVAGLVEKGIPAIGVIADVCDEASVRAMADEAREAFGGIDILVNGAALLTPVASTNAEGDLEALRLTHMNYPIELWDRIVKINLTGALICAQACVPSMIERGRGKIINIISAGAWLQASGAYSVSKLGLVGLTIGLAKELGKYKINVNAIAPGMIRHEHLGQAALDVAHVAWRGQEESHKVRGVPAIQALGTPDELCGALLYLASAASNFVTGHTLNVDGGWVMRT